MKNFKKYVWPAAAFFCCLLVILFVSTKYEMGSRAGASTYDEELVDEMLKESQLSAIYIETTPGAMTTVNANKDAEADCTVVILGPDGTENFKGRATLSGAGNSNWRQPKKPYNLKFEQSVNLLSLGNASLWRLFSNSLDESLMRNYLAFSAANELGIRYSGKLAYASLYINGEYNGVYCMGTKKEYENDPSNVQAVFEKCDSTSRDYDYSPDEGTYITYEYGDKAMIRDKVDQFDSALREGASYSEIQEYIDVESFVKKYLLEVAFANGDNIFSQYFSVNGEGKIECICPWDYDLTLGAGWAAVTDKGYNADVISNSWYRTLYDSYPEFQQMVLEYFYQYEDVFSAQYEENLAYASALLEKDWQINRIRWDEEMPLGSLDSSLKNTENIMSLQANVSYLSDFMQKRIAFLEGYLSKPSGYCSLTVEFAQYNKFRIFVPKGTKVSEIDYPDGFWEFLESDDSIIGFQTESGVSLLEMDELNEDMYFYLVGGTLNTEEDPFPLSGNMISVLLVLAVFVTCFLLAAAAEIRKISLCGRRENVQC